MKLRRMVVLAAVLLACCRSGASQANASYETDKQRVKSIFETHDLAFAPHAKPELPLEAYLDSVADDIILMPHGAVVLEGKDAYRKHLREILGWGQMKIRHELIEVYSYPEIVVARGRAIGTFFPNGGGTPNPFETKNVFIFRRVNGQELKVWQIIFNHEPAKPGSPTSGQ